MDICRTQNYYIQPSLHNIKKYPYYSPNYQYYYTSTFDNDNIIDNIKHLSTYYNFYPSDIYRIFIDHYYIIHNYHCIYIKSNHEIVGFILFSTNKNEVILQFIFIQPQSRRNHLSYNLINLMQNTICRLKNLGLIKFNKNAVYSTFTKNPIMMNLLQKFNYKKINKHNNPKLKNHSYFIKHLS
jgi:hypothetical protein